MARIGDLADVIRNPALPKGIAEQVLANAGWGTLLALKHGELALEEAEDRVFNLDVYLAARGRRFDRNLVEFLEWGMQLEDVLEIAPGSIQDDYREMTRLIHRVLLRSRKRTAPSQRRLVGAHSRTGA
jgi:hypothetical protein